MSGWLGEKRPRGTRVVTEEIYNRDGHWIRQFPVRTDPWSVVEHWASENKYYLVAFRGQRRLYQKETGWGSLNYLTYVDLKFHDGRMTVVSWIFVSFAFRILSLFLLPSEMSFDPHGIIGVRKRRQTCRELNLLLSRFKQVPIIGSSGLHFMDLDPSTLLVGGLSFLTLFLSLYVTTMKLQIQPLLANVLLWKMGKHLLSLIVVAAILVVIHDLFIIRRWSLPLYKWVSAGCAMTIFIIVVLLLTMKTGQEMKFEKLAYHCWYRFSESSCREQVLMLPLEERTHLFEQIQRLQSEIAIKPR